MINDIKRFIKRNSKITKVCKEINNKVMFNANIGEITTLSARRSDFKEKRINLLVPSINQEHIFGGISTALKFYNQLCDKKGYKRRIITTDASPLEDDLKHFEGYILQDSEEDESIDFQIVPFNDRYNKTIPVGENDIFISTAWWTAYSAQNLIKWQSEEYKNKVKKSIYFIQDFEPGFYAWSSRYALADSTYKSELPQIAVFNTYLLMEYFNKNNYKFDEEYSFEPVLNEGLKQVLDKLDIFKKKKQILIYGRPSVQRNAFELIIESLKIWVWKQSNVNEWKIYSVGEKHPDIQLGNEMKVESLGKLSLDEYANLMAESYLGISLMISPHPSYPPLEMSTFGMKVITNNFANKDISSFNENIVSLNVLSTISINDSLIKITNNYTEEVCKNVHYNYINNTDIFNFIDKIDLR